MKISLRSRYKQILALLVLICVLFFLIQSSLKTWLAFSYAEGPQPEGLLKASGVDPENPDYYFLIAYYLNEYESSNEAILGNYKKALTLSPFNYNYWFYLADYLYEMGNREKALYTLNQAVALSPGTVSLRWRAGMFAVKLNDNELVLQNLRNVIEFDPTRRTKAFSLLWQSVDDGNRILNIISENALSPYYYYLRTTDRIEEAGAVLEKLNNLNYDTSTATSLYVNDLIQSGKLALAREKWIETFGNWEGVWNGDFEEELMNIGFDWRIFNINGATIRRVREPYNGSYSIMVDFDGKHNMNFDHFRQIIPVKEKTKYKLSLYIKDKDLATKNVLRWKINCLDTEGLDVASEPITGTKGWEPMSLSFLTPEYCNAVVLRLKRKKSEKIDNLISGTLWIDDVQLKKTPNRP